MNTHQKTRFWTVPNILSLVRLFMIPQIVWLYCVKQDAVTTGVLLVLSGATDLVDGYVARRFDQVSDFGKALDPIADKLTQLAMLLCLVTQYPKMIFPFVLLLTKEIVTGIMSLVAISKTARVEGAIWHGKLTTVMLYAMMTLHVLCPEMPSWISHITVGMCSGMMLLSFVLYAIRNIRSIQKPNKEIELTVYKHEN